MTKCTALLGGILSHLIITHHHSPHLSPVAAESVYDYAEAYHSLLEIHNNENDDTNTPDNQDIITDPFQNVQFAIHRNGEAEPCSLQRMDVSVSSSLIHSLKVLDVPLDKYNKYHFDALLTHALAVGSGSKLQPDGLLTDNGSDCHPTWKEDDHYLDHLDNLQHNAAEGEQHKTQHAVLVSPFLKFCDMGHNRTPIQHDHDRLVRIPPANSLPCHIHTREGLRIDSLQRLADFAGSVKKMSSQINSDECDATKKHTSCINKDNTSNQVYELHLYAVPAGRLFMFAPKHIGEVFTLSHLSSSISDDTHPISLTVLSLSPKLFDIHNFFTRDESTRIVNKALRETRESYRIKRSSTGASGSNDNSRRTGENGFDTSGKEARAMKRRCMKVLGFDVYEEALTDGLQVLRYNQTTAYVPHLDWIDDVYGREEHDYDSTGVGSNRFATVLMYMSDLQESDGGETVFPKGLPIGVAEEDRASFHTALSQLRESGDVEGLLGHGSWEESMVAQCRSSLSVRPHSSRAVLFYNQEPDGSPDLNSVHGGCPVIGKEKWAGEISAVLACDICITLACVSSIFLHCLTHIVGLFVLIFVLIFNTSQPLDMECTTSGLSRSPNQQESKCTQQ